MRCSPITHVFTSEVKWMLFLDLANNDGKMSKGLSVVFSPPVDHNNVPFKATSLIFYVGAKHLHFNSFCRYNI